MHGREPCLAALEELGDSGPEVLTANRERTWGHQTFLENLGP